jgi:hypothetical protein
MIRNRWKTTAEIQDYTRSVAVHSDVAAVRAELKKRKMMVQSKCLGKNTLGNMVWAYRAIKKENQ